MEHRPLSLGLPPDNFLEVARRGCGLGSPQGEEDWGKILMVLPFIHLHDPVYLHEGACMCIGSLQLTRANIEPTSKCIIRVQIVHVNTQCWY